jgi:hypothetical protein
MSFRLVRLTGWIVVAAATVAVLIGVRTVCLPRAVSISKAQRMLAGPPHFEFAGDHGQPVARCTGPALFGIFSTTTTDSCTLTFPSGHVYSCKVDAAPPAYETGAGAAARCDPHPESRPSQRV